MEKILLDSLYGEVQNATKGLPLTPNENLFGCVVFQSEHK